MWSLLTTGQDIPIYKPTDFIDAGSDYIDPTLAYDVDEYPWLTSANGSFIGSAVTAVYDDHVIEYKDFGTLAKANFNEVWLEIYYSGSVTLGVKTGSSYITTAAIVVEYSYDGGTLWHTISEVDGAWGAGPHDEPFNVVNYPAQYINTGTVDPYVVNQSFVKASCYAIFSSTLFTTGLQDLRVRFTLSSITKATHSSSQCSVNVWDIRATIL